MSGYVWVRPEDPLQGCVDGTALKPVLGHSQVAATVELEFDTMRGCRVIHP